MKKDFPFKKEFDIDGRKIVLVCDDKRGLVQMFNPQTGNYVNVSVHTNGNIEITACMVFPRSRIDITKSSIHQKGSYDSVRLKVGI